MLFKIPRQLIRLGAVLASLVFVAFVYQNCSPGFTSVPVMSNNSSSVAPIPTPTPPSPQPSPTADNTPFAANVLGVNPFIAANNPNLALDADLNSFLTSTHLQNLLTNVNYLSNGRVALDIDDAFPQQIASPSGSLVFNATDPRMPQVSSYYHVDNFVQALKTEGVGPTTAPLVHLNAHCQNGASSTNNAYFDPQTMQVCLGSATIPGGFVAWGSYDSDVAVHEFGHSVNHATSTTDILSSSADLGALDEGLADTWAYLHNGNSSIADWYGLAIYKALGISTTNFKGLRDLTLVPSYPNYLDGERHDDSIAYSTVIYELNKKGASIPNLHKLSIRVLSDLQSGDDFDNIASYMIKESSASGVDTTALTTALQARGLYRKDDVSQVTLAASDVAIIDNHAFSSAQVGGNCNKQLDVGETAIVVLNLGSPAASLGAVKVRLSSAAGSGITVSSGANTANYFRINSGSKFFNGLPTNTQLRHLDTIYAAFLVRGDTAGSHALNVSLTGFDSMDTTPSTKQITVNITVGTAATMTTACSSASLEASVWP
jgi:hypothetical protein